MDDNAFSIYSNVFGIVVGSVSLITLAFGLHMHFPSKKIKYLESVLDETEKLFQSALEDGLLPQHKFTSWVEARLYQLREDTMLLRPRAYRATTWVQDCKELLKGLSLAIGKVCYQVRELRAEIITSSEAQRRNLSARRNAATSSASSSSHVISPVGSNSMMDRTNSSASSIAAPESVESTIAESSHDKAESFATAQELSDAVSNLSARLTGRVSPDWRRIWKHGVKHAIQPGSHDHVHEVNVGQIPDTKTRAIRLGGYYYTVPVQTLPPEALP
ncbi:hypothetical protein F5I97DRAFT_1925826 [Phlebopus sp. FC_14]|nr:hypothetical protein F5I97DRAFT_1925826 [Phlebopus sp. FC_14]